MSATLTTLRDLADQYDAFLIDQFGVLLDGAGAYENAPWALSELAKTGKPIVILSNSGKRAAPNEARLTRLGFARGDYQTVLSSGEAAYRLLSEMGGDRRGGATPVWLHARDGDQSAIEGLNLRSVASASEADLLILAGSQGDQQGLEWYRAELTPAAQRAVPCYCTNPDLEMLTPQGKAFGAGRIAALYEELGGSVTYIGKPYLQIYQIAGQILGQIAPRGVLCIGDSPAHDVLGGAGAGFSTALVRDTGLHAGADFAHLQEICEGLGARLDHVIPAFDWES